MEYSELFKNWTPEMWPLLYSGHFEMLYACFIIQITLRINWFQGWPDQRESTIFTKPHF